MKSEKRAQKPSKIDHFSSKMSRKWAIFSLFWRLFDGK
jgi:hypothetical protein